MKKSFNRGNHRFCDHDYVGLCRRRCTVRREKRIRKIILDAPEKALK